MPCNESSTEPCGSSLQINNLGVPTAIAKDGRVSSRGLFGSITGLDAADLPIRSWLLPTQTSENHAEAVLV